MSGSNSKAHHAVRRYGKDALNQAVSLLKDGKLVAIPTETVYGLAADSTNAGAVAAIYTAKGRPDFNPLIVHVSSLAKAQTIAKFDEPALLLAEKFWPGPLTLVLPKDDNCPATAAVTAGLSTIAIRCPAHPIMRDILESGDLILAAPSANRSGGISPTRAEHVAASLEQGVSLIVDGGPTEQGLESTIVAVRENGYEILRHGPVTAEQLFEILGAPLGGEAHVPKIEAPGQLSSHYAPSKPVRLNATHASESEFLIGFGSIEGDLNLSPAEDLAEAASRLFECLHKADASERAAIAIAPIPNEAIGAAINDRISRAASAR